MENFVQTRLDIFAEAYWKEVDKLAEDIFQTHVIPYCDATGRKFFAGMGDWFFIDNYGNYYKDETDLYLVCDENDNEFWTTELPEDLVKILESSTANHANDLGSLMRDYTPAGYTRENT